MELPQLHVQGGPHKLFVQQLQYYSVHSLQGSRVRRGHLAWFRRERLPWPEKKGGLVATCPHMATSLASPQPSSRQLPAPARLQTKTYCKRSKSTHSHEEGASKSSAMCRLAFLGFLFTPIKKCLENSGSFRESPYPNPRRLRETATTLGDKSPCSWHRKPSRRPNFCASAGS